METASRRTERPLRKTDLVFGRTGKNGSPAVSRRTSSDNARVNIRETGFSANAGGLISISSAGSAAR